MSRNDARAVWSMEDVTAAIGSAISGERPAVRIVASDDADGEQAHESMARACRRGTCAILADETQQDGLREQRSAWLMADGCLVLTTWYQAPGETWTRGSSYQVGSDAVAGLAELLERNGR